MGEMGSIVHYSVMKIHIIHTWWYQPNHDPKIWSWLHPLVTLQSPQSPRAVSFCLEYWPPPHDNPLPMDSQRTLPTQWEVWPQLGTEKYFIELQWEYHWSWPQCKKNYN